MNENQVPNQEINNTTMSQINGNEANNTVSTPVIESVSSSIPPIAEVKVEVEATMVTSDENSNQDKEISVSPISGGNSEQPSTEPPKSSKTSTILLILLFIFLFAFIMGMPYIREFVQDMKADKGLSEIEKEAKEEEEKQQQEEESKKPTPTPEDEKTTELVCTSNGQTVGNYTVVQTQKLYYNSKNQVLSSKMISSYDFVVVDNDYNSLKQQCDEDSLKYLTHEGYTMACSYGENNIEISHEFDLETFTPIVDGTTNIQANATYQQNLDEIKANLISQGYTCQ